MKKIILYTCTLLIISVGTAQQIRLNDEAKLTFSGSTDIFFSYDLNSTFSSEKPSFLVNYRTNREVNLNFGMIKINYEGTSTRANFGLMTGTYIKYNLSTESEFVRNIYEANAGFKICKKSNTWIDAGIMPSHIGHETMLSKDNLLLTKSIVADNTPYYETGVRISHRSKNEKLYLAGMILNGWQRIGRNSPLGFGMQINYKASEKVELNYSNYFGKMNVSEIRYYNNMYAKIKISKKWNTILSFDMGIQKLVTNYGVPRMWFSPTIALQYKYNDKINFAGRIEYFGDTAGVIIQLNNFSGLKTVSAALGFDYHFNKYMLWRNEFKFIASNKSIYYRREKPEARANNYSYTTALVFQF